MGGSYHIGVKRAGIHEDMEWLKRNWTAILLIAALAFVWQVQHDALERQRDAFVEGCERGNALRSELNERVPALTNLSRGLVAALGLAEQSILEGPNPNEEAARQFGRLRVGVREEARFTRLTIVDCESIIPKV